MTWLKMLMSVLPLLMLIILKSERFISGEGRCVTIDGVRLGH